VNPRDPFGLLLALSLVVVVVAFAVVIVALLVVVGKVLAT
jgi:hypothetical protein